MEEYSKHKICADSWYKTFKYITNRWDWIILFLGGDWTYFDDSTRDEAMAYADKKAEELNTSYRLIPNEKGY